MSTTNIWAHAEPKRGEVGIRIRHNGGVDGLREYRAEDGSVRLSVFYAPQDALAIAGAIIQAAREVLER
jgi:hypothetical protein